jgi:hypothetical protein
MVSLNSILILINLVGFALAFFALIFVFRGMVALFRMRINGEIAIGRVVDEVNEHWRGHDGVDDVVRRLTFEFRDVDGRTHRYTRTDELSLDQNIRLGDRLLLNYSPQAPEDFTIHRRWFETLVKHLFLLAFVAVIVLVIVQENIYRSQ